MDDPDFLRVMDDYIETFRRRADCPRRGERLLSHGRELYSLILDAVPLKASEAPTPEEALSRTELANAYMLRPILSSHA